MPPSTTLLSASELGNRASVVAAVVTAGVAVVVAVLGQVETSRRDRAGRRYERRRSALLDVQDTALAVRRTLRAYGEALRASVGQARGPVRVSAPRADDHEYAEATGTLEVRAVRLDDDAGGRQVAVALQQWLTASQEHFLGAADVTAADEQQAWRVLNQAVARALRS